MIVLSVDNSLSKIEGISVKQHKELSDLLSYTVDAQAAYFSGRWRSRKQTLLGKRGDFPSGLLYLVEHYLNKTFYQYKDLRTRPNKRLDAPKMTLPYTEYKEQAEASLMAYKEGRGIITAPTGVGKSVIIAGIINNLQVPTLVVVPTLELKRQLTENFKQYFGSQFCGSICDNKFIAVENVDALDLVASTKYDCVIIDEFHHAAAKTYRKLNKKAWNNIYYRFGITATPFRSRDNERLLLESVLSKVIYQIDYQAAVKNGYIMPLEAYYIEAPITKVEGYTWAEVYAELVVNNAARNELLSKLLVKFHVNKCATLCLVKEIKHGEILSKLTGIPFANGQTEGSTTLIQQFSSGQLNSLIATSGVCGEGVDTRAAEYVVISGLGKARGQFMQQCGRGFRKYPGKESCKIILIKDRSHKFTLRHFNEQVKILKDEYGSIPVKLEL